MPKRVDHELRRRQIVEAVWRITARGGLSAASFREVAAEAGVSVRLVQYYFGTKAELLHAANRHVAEQASARIVERVTSLGTDAPPDRVVRAVVREFLPLDDERREAMLLFFAFYTAQMTDPTLARSEAADVPEGLAALVARQIRRAQASGAVPASLNADLEGTILTAALPGIASGVLVNYLSARDAAKVMDYAVDRIFTEPGRTKGAKKRAARSTRGQVTRRG